MLGGQSTRMHETPAMPQKELPPAEVMPKDSTYWMRRVGKDAFEIGPAGSKDPSFPLTGPAAAGMYTFLRLQRRIENSKSLAKPRDWAKIEEDLRKEWRALDTSRKSADKWTAIRSLLRNDTQQREDTAVAPILKDMQVTDRIFYRSKNEKRPVTDEGSENQSNEIDEPPIEPKMEHGMGPYVHVQNVWHGRTDDEARERSNKLDCVNTVATLIGLVDKGLENSFKRSIILGTHQHALKNPDFATLDDALAAQKTPTALVLFTAPNIEQEELLALHKAGQKVFYPGQGLIVLKPGKGDELVCFEKIDRNLPWRLTSLEDIYKRYESYRNNFGPDRVNLLWEGYPMGSI